MCSSKISGAIRLKGKQDDHNQDHFDTSHLHDDLKALSVRGGMVTGLAQVSRLLIGLGAIAVLARLLTPGDFGLIVMVLPLSGFLSLFSDAGLSAATVQRDKINHSQVSTLFWLNVLLGFGLMAIMAAMAPVVVWFYRDEQLLAITLVLSISFPITALAIQHKALLRRQLRFSSLAAISVLAQVLGYSAAIGIAFLGASYWSLVAATLVTTAVETSMILLVSGWVPGRMSRGSGVREMIRFGGELTGFEVINYAAANLDRVLLGRIWGDYLLGLYWSAHRLVTQPLKQINNPLAGVAMPTLSRIQTEPERYKLAYLRVLEKLTLLTMPMAVLMISSPDWIIHLFLGPQWLEAAKVLFILGFAAVLLPIANTSGWLFVSQGRSKDMLHWGLIDALIKIMSIVIALPWGPVGLAIAVAARTYLAFPLLWWITCRKGPVRARDIYRGISPALLAGTFALLAAVIYRYFAGSINPLVGILIVASIILVVMLTVLAVIPAGRKILSDSYNLLVFILKRKAA